MIEFEPVCRIPTICFARRPWAVNRTSVAPSANPNWSDMLATVWIVVAEPRPGVKGRFDAMFFVNAIDDAEHEWHVRAVEEYVGAHRDTILCRGRARPNERDKPKGHVEVLQVSLHRVSHS